MPPEVEAAIDKRSSMAAVGNLNDYVKFQMAQGLREGGSGVGGVGAEMAVGMCDGAADDESARRHHAQATPAAGAAPAARRRDGVPETLGPADAAKALGVSEADVDRQPRGRRSEGQADRHAVAHHARGARRVPEVAVTSWPRRRTARVASGRPRPWPRRARSSTVRRAAPRRNWNPAKQALICPFCGTESPATLAGARRRHGHRRARPRRRAAGHSGLRARLAGRRRPRSGARAARPFRSSTPSKIGQRCDFCGSTALVPYEEVKDAFRPESLLPLKIVGVAGARPDSRLVRPAVARAQHASSAKALTDTVKGIYLPYWTFDAKADAHWTAEAGHYYYVREGNKQVQQVRWTPAAGELSHVFDDDLVCASVGVDPARCGRSNRFRPTTLVPYDPGYLAGWTVERYQIDLVAAAERSRQQMDDELRDTVRPAGARRHLPQSRRARDIQRPDVQAHPGAGLADDLRLRRAKSYQVVVNGVTGAIAGSQALELDQDQPSHPRGYHHLRDRAVHEQLSWFRRPSRRCATEEDDVQSEQRLNRISGGVVLGLSLFAMVLVLGATVLCPLGRFDPSPDGDEGTPAHLFQSRHRSARADGADIPRDGQLAHPEQIEVVLRCRRPRCWSRSRPWCYMEHVPVEKPRRREGFAIDPAPGGAGGRPSWGPEGLCPAPSRQRGGRESGSAPSCRSRVRWAPRAT